MGQNIGIEADNKKPSHLDGLVQVTVGIQVSVTDAVSVAQNWEALHVRGKEL